MMGQHFALIVMMAATSACIAPSVVAREDRAVALDSERVEWSPGAASDLLLPLPALGRASIGAARAQAELCELSVRFLRADLYRCPLHDAAFDFVVVPDVLEHLSDPAAALREAARLLRPGGRMFLSTFDRTWRSRVAVVTVAEGLGLVPRGTHDARLFVRPDELHEYARESGLTVQLLVRESPALLRTAFTWTVHLRESRRGPGYSAFLVKEGA